MIGKLQIANWLINPDNQGNLPLEEAEEKIKKLNLEKVYQEIELPLIPVLKKMKDVGIKLDQTKIKILLNKFNRQIKLLENKIYQAAGEKFNINSPRQMSLIIFKKLKLNNDQRANQDFHLSTRAEKLLELQDKHPIIGLILRYREAFKIKSTYLEPLSKAGERVYTDFIQTGAATGRLSSRNPNLQNIPPVVREVFIADRGYRLVSFDYSQIELRIKATVTGDAQLIKAFKTGIDIHALTASRIFKVDVKKVTKNQRQIAKTLNFGMTYGMGPAAFARTSGLSREEARQFISDYFQQFKKVKEWQTEILRKTRSNGYVENLNGRKRWLPNINSGDRFLAAEAERAAVNMPIQGLAADIIKLAMIAVYKKIKKTDDLRLLLTIHDELLFEIKNDKLKASSKTIKKIMENIYPLAVDLEVNVAQGKNWGNL